MDPFSFKAGLDHQAAEELIDTIYSEPHLSRFFTGIASLPRVIWSAVRAIPGNLRLLRIKTTRKPHPSRDREYPKAGF
jgi:hypothetical protein